MNIKDGGPTIDAMLRHLAFGQDLRDLPGTPSERLALVRTACTRELIIWRKARRRYELTSIGWRELTPSRRFSLASLMVSTAIGAAVGAASLAVAWLPGESSQRSIRGQLSAPVSRLERPVAAPASSWTEVSVRSPMPPQTASGSLSCVPVVADEPGPTETPGNPIEPPMVADLSVPEQPSAEAPPTSEKLVKKSRHKTVHRRRRGSTWAHSDRWRARQFRYADYGAQGAWVGYR
jgi:hypothetical protein